MLVGDGRPKAARRSVGTPALRSESCPATKRNPALRNYLNCDLRLTRAQSHAHKVGCRTGLSSTKTSLHVPGPPCDPWHLARRLEHHHRNLGTWFVTLVVIGIILSVWQSRDKWRSQARYWCRSRI